MNENDIASVEWEYEDALPEFITNEDYDRLFENSQIRDGVRMFPFITYNSTRIFLAK